MTRGGIFPRCDDVGWTIPYWDLFLDPSNFLIEFNSEDPEDSIPTEENDILIMAVVHRGTNWGVFPVGWTLIAREIAGATRGEVYWKRATAGESGSYTVTGMESTAVGFAMSLAGCIKTGSPIANATARSNASSASGTVGITTAANNSLIFNIGAFSKAVYFKSPYFTAANLPIMFGPEDFSTGRNGGCEIAVAYQMMPVAGATGATACTMYPGYEAANVGICFALIPDPTEPSLTYDEEIATPCTNTTEGTAKEITVPYTLVESMEDGTQDLYFKFTPTTQNLYFIQPWINPCYGQYTPAIDVYYYSGATQVYLYYGWPLGNFLDSFLTLLSPGVTYYLHLMNESGYELDQTGIEFILKITQASTGLPSGVPHIGDLWVPDDTAGYPAALINPLTGLVRGYFPYPVGERGDTIESGYSLHEDIGADRRMLYLYDSEINLVATVGPLGSYVMGLQIYGGYSDHFWVAHFTTNNTNTSYLLKTVNIDGSIGAKIWTLPRPLPDQPGSGSFPKALCVNPEGTIVYYALLVGTYPNYIDVIYRYDLVNDVPLSDLANGVANYAIAGDRAFVMQDDTIFMAYNDLRCLGGPETSSFIRRYDPDGSVIQDYDFDGYFIDRMCLDYNEDYFWVWCFTVEDGMYGTHSHFFHVKASDGSIDNHIITHNQQDGLPIIGSNAETDPFGIQADIHYVYPSLGPYGYTSDSCPMFVIRKGLQPDTGDEDIEEPCYEFEGCTEPYGEMVEYAN